MVDPVYSEINGSLDENNVDSTSADGIAILQNAQTFTGAKTFNNNTVIGNGYGLNIGDATQQVVSAGDGSTDLTPELQVLGTAQADASSLHAAWSTTATRAAAPTIALLKSGNATIGSHTTVTDNEILGSIIAYGDDETDYESPAAAIEFAVDGTPGTGQMPGEIVMYTTASGGETLTEAIRVSSAQSTTFSGAVTVGVDNTGYDVTLFGDSAGAYFLWDQSADTLDIRGATAAGPGAISLETGELTVVDGDILGRIDFSAPLESDGTDAVLVGASIWAEADDAFSASNNDTDLVFAVAESETAAERMRLSYDGTATSLALTGATVMTLSDGSITDSSGAISFGNENLTTTGVITGATVEATGDTSADDNAAMGYTSAEGLILTGQGSTSDVTIKNDADTTVMSIATGTDDVTFADDLLLSSGAVINFNSGDVTVTHSSNTLTITGGITALDTSSTIGNLTLANGSITDSSGAISFGNENLTSTGTADFGATTVDSLSVSDGSITNVNDIALDSISADGSSITISNDTFISNGLAFVLGHSAQLTGAQGQIPEGQVIGTGFHDTGMGFYRFSADSGGPVLNFASTRGASVGTYTAVQSGDVLGAMYFGAADGTDIQSEAARIEVQAAETATSNNVDGDILLYTTANGNSPTERMRIDSGGNVGIGVNPDYNLHVQTAAATTMRVGTTSTSATTSIDIFGNGSGTNVQQLRFRQGDGGGSTGNMGYIFYLNNSDNRFAIESSDTNGSGASADIIRVNDGQLTIDANSTWDDNAFDYVCDDCGWHSLHETESCPACGGNVEWHDDNALIFDVVSTEEKREQGLDRLGKMGVVRRYGKEDGGDFICLQDAHQFTWSAMSQMYQLVKKQEKEIESLKRKVV